ncbi:MAG: hypothetical protein AAGF20_11965 [Pseudomonadota bacterium]
MSDIGMILDRIGHKLVAEVAPKLEGDYSGGHAAMSGLMAVMAGEAWDAAADRLVNEIKAMRVLLEQGGVDPSIEPAQSLKISDLTAERDALAALLVDLQAALETKEAPEAAALNAAIWGYLMQTAAARMPSPPEFPDVEEDST